MKTEELFNKLFNSTCLSSYVCFAVAIMGKKVPKNSLKTAFKKLVNKEDFVGTKAEVLLTHLEELTASEVTFETWKKSSKSSMN
jgi:hypothetical protein